MLENRLKVYYLPLPVMFRQCIWTNFINLSAYLRRILIDEEIDILHSHGGFSTMAQESMVFGNLLNLGMVFTEHSLHGFSDLGCFALNQIWKLTAKPVDTMIGVSFCQTANQFYRLGGIDFSDSESQKSRKNEKNKKFITVPNAIYPEMYLPPEKPKNEHSEGYKTIVVVSRLTGRKGTPLMISTIEKLFLKDPRLKLLIAGDGPLTVQVEELREKYRWHHRIELKGSVQPSQVRNILIQGRIFLNCSLSEAFCMAIVEAACAGLHVVTTNVGGIPEVLPEDNENIKVALSEPDSGELMEKLERAVEEEYGKSDLEFNEQRWRQFEEVRKLYTWTKIAKTVEVEYWFGGFFEIWKKFEKKILFSKKCQPEKHKK